MRRKTRGVVDKRRACTLPKIKSRFDARMDVCVRNVVDTLFEYAENSVCILLAALPDIATVWYMLQYATGYMQTVVFL